MKHLVVAIPGIIIISASKHDDERGFFSEIYNKRDYENVGIKCNIVQDNQSFSAKKWTIRGLHYQDPPYDQEKLVRVNSLCTWLRERDMLMTWARHAATMFVFCTHSGWPRWSSSRVR